MKRSRVSFSARAIAAGLGKGVEAPIGYWKVASEWCEPRRCDVAAQAVSARLPSNDEEEFLRSGFPLARTRPWRIAQFKQIGGGGRRGARNDACGKLWPV